MSLSIYKTTIYLERQKRLPIISYLQKGFRSSSVSDKTKQKKCSME